MNLSDQNNPLHRRSVRLAGYDYSQPGEYFITICAYQHQQLFGAINDEEMLLNRLGEIVRDEWEKTPSIRKGVELGTFIIMPNHFHAIVHIVDIDDHRNDPQPAQISSGVACFSNTDVGAYGYTPLPNVQLRSASKTIGAIVRGFKGAATTRINTLRETPGNPVWQRNYYEHIITTEKEYLQIESYIENNPSNLVNDSEY